MRKRLLGLLSALFIASSVNAGQATSTPGCTNAEVIGSALITDICWSCVFPIRVSGLTISGAEGSDRVPDGAARQALCMCTDGAGVPRPGIVTSFWQPSHLVEYEHVPGCMSALNGARLPFDKTFLGHDIAETEWGEEDYFAFRHYHIYAFPLMIMLDMFVPAHCNAGGYRDLDVMFLSEVDPTWNNDTLAFFTHFEAALVANPLATSACLADATSSTFGKPIDTLWWCAGSWGTIYPITGNVTEDGAVLRQTSLMSARTMAQLHRRGIMWGTMGDERLCGGEIEPTIPKNQYRFTLLYPKPETDSSHAFGESVLTWGMNRMFPALGEDPVYTVWRWIDCCNY